MPKTRDDSPHPALLTGLAAAGLGLAELAWHVHAGGPLETGSLVAGAAVVAGVYGLIGLGIGVLARAVCGLPLRVLRTLRGRASSPALALAVPLVAALLARLWSDWAPVGVRALQLALALSLAAVVFLAARALLQLGSWRAPGRVVACVSALAVLALAAAGLHDRSQPAFQPEAGGPSALLVTIDTLRADHVGAYGHAAARTPVIDGLAADGYLFEHATAPCVLTGPSHTSILTGLLPMQHGVIENVHAVGRDVRTVAETLGDAGWDTAAFVSGYPVSNRASGLLARFDHYDDDMRDVTLVPRRAMQVSLGRLAQVVLDPLGVDLDPHWRTAPRVTDSAVAWLEQGGSRPFFAWVHYFDPHLPYEAPDELVDDADRAFAGPRGEGWYGLSADQRRAVVESPEAVARMGRLYDAEVALVDRELARLVEAARRRAGDDLWIVVTSDHGESFGEHGIWYRRELYDPSLHVPLIVVPPGRRADGTRAEGRRVAAQVRLIDVTPTLLDALGLAEALPTEGRSLRPLMAGDLAEAPGPSVAALFTTRADPYQRTVLSVRNGRWKSIWRQAGWLNTDAAFSGETRELYDLASDPGELHDLADEMPELWESLHSMAGELQLELRSSDALSDEDLEILRSLGYTM